MKFGGTSVADAERIKRAARRIVAARELGHRVVAVLSARGKTTDELISMLAGLWELVPWLRQWHNEIDPVFGERLGEFFASYTQSEAIALGCTTDDLTAWRAPAPVKRGRKKS